MRPTSASELRLDDQLCFALYRATNQIVRAYRPLLSELGLTYPQYLVMMVLWERDDLSIAEIAQRLDLPPHGVTPVITRLAAAGRVVRRPDSHDGRVVRVRLTSSGARLEQAAAMAQASVVRLTGLTAEELSSLRDQLHAFSRGNAVDAVPASATAGRVGAPRG